VDIAVLGATGRIGRRIVGEAAGRGHTVIAVVRNDSSFDASSLRAWRRRPSGPGTADDPDDGGPSRPVTIERADVFDATSVAAALGDASVVISAVGHAAPSGDQTFYVRAAESLVTALRSRGALRSFGTHDIRLLVVGGFGSLRMASGRQLANANIYPDDARAEILGQRDALTYFRTVDDVEWTYISPPPGGIRSGTRTGLYRAARNTVIGEPSDSRITFEDFAVAVIDEAERADHPHACIAIAH
jgi:hypothetical protein